ncbi:MAG: DNA repair protein RadC [Bacteroidetes bacterium]|nr:DNA repair protein RadC [Bacteroidota bacterium]
MNYEYASTDELVKEITGRTVSGLPRLREIARNPDILSDVSGIGAVSAKRIQAALELGRRYVGEPDTDRISISGPEDVARVYGPRLRDLDHERFYVILLNNAGQIIGEHLVSQGIVNASLVHPREVFREAIRMSASSVILLHNHPSGVREASREDHLITKQLAQAGKLIDIPVHDHIIITGSSYVSFAENGWLD